MNIVSAGEPGTGGMAVGSETLGLLMPMHLWLDPVGKIVGIGPTLAKILGTDRITGSDFSDHFRLLRGRLRTGHAAGKTPEPPSTAQECYPMVGEYSSVLPLRFTDGLSRMHVALVAHPGVTLRGISAPTGKDGVILNFTFGIHIAEAVGDFRLTEADFAATDLAIELLYMEEANLAVLGELSQLAARLDYARRNALEEAMTDPLTGIANRRAFEIALEDAMQSRALGDRGFAIAHLDLDDFKSVNDGHGHAIGDEVLIQVAQRLSRDLRHGDLVARTGGDEFLILFRGLTDPGLLARVGERLIARLEKPFSFEGGSSSISASIGISVSTSYDPATLQRMVEDADSALYVAKRSGRGRCILFPMEDLRERGTGQ